MYGSRNGCPNRPPSGWLRHHRIPADGPSAVGSLIGAPQGVFEPDPARHATYQPLFALYERVYGRLTDEFDLIAALQAHV